jgi:hypothetical protein
MSLTLGTFIYITNYGTYVKDMRRPWPVNESNSHMKKTQLYRFYSSQAKVYGHI